MLMTCRVTKTHRQMHPSCHVATDCAVVDCEIMMSTDSPWKRIDWEAAYDFWGPVLSAMISFANFLLDDQFRDHWNSSPLVVVVWSVLLTACY